jgi:excisionase family DNA binding protein
MSDTLTIETAKDPTPAEVAAVLRIGRSTVFSLIHRGELRHLRVGNGQRARVLVYKSDLQAWIESSKQGRIATK